MRPTTGFRLPHLTAIMPSGFGSSLAAPLEFGGRGPCFRTQPIDTLPGGGGAADPFAARIWTEENRIASLGQSRIVSLPGLSKGARELHGKWAKVSGLEKFDGVFLRDVYADESSTLTTDHHDQIQAYWAITSLLTHLESLGFDMARILGDWKPVVADVNENDRFNANFYKLERRLVFGTGERSKSGAWHLAEDHDIVRHELGHLIFHCIIPTFVRGSSGDSYIIHESIGDGMAAFIRNDPEISESYLAGIGSEYGPDMGLRNLDNEFKYDENGRGDVHLLSRFLGGFWWSVRKALEPMMGDARAAADLTLAILTEHGAHYATNKPGQKDLLDAAIVGARTYLEGSGKFDVGSKQVASIMRAEAKKRGMTGRGIKMRGKRLRASSKLTDVFLQLSDHNTFVRRASTRGTFGGRDFLQQYYVLDNRELATMLGSGLILFLDQSGNVHSYSASDVRFDIKVDKTIRVGRRSAVKRIRTEAEKQLGESELRLRNPGCMKLHSEDDERLQMIDIARAEIRRQAAELALGEVKERGDPDIGERVIMPEGFGGKSTGREHLYWKYEFGPATFYVDAKTGEVFTA